MTFEAADLKTKKVVRWYFGGMASIGAACVTHPLDLIKVHLQTQQHGKIGLIQTGIKVVRSHGLLGLYNGLTASTLWQATYSLTRFTIYEGVKKELEPPGAPKMPFYQKILLGAVSGCVGGLVGTPADMINVRMQNDIKLPPEQRRNYKHSLDGLYRVIRDEGATKLLSGATMASTRGLFVTIGQLAFYDQFKALFLETGLYDDSVYLHVSSSLLAPWIGNGWSTDRRRSTDQHFEKHWFKRRDVIPAFQGASAALLTMPVDVMKTRMMNAPPGTYSGIFDCAKDIARAGPLGFFKGVFPAFVRLAPHTVLIFVFLEQLRLRFGYDVPIKN